MGKGGGQGRATARAAARASGGASASTESGPEHFGSSKARVQVDPDLTGKERKALLGRTRSLLGERATFQDLGSVIGAPDDALVTFRETARGLEIYMSSGQMTATRKLYRDSKGDLVLHNDYFAVYQKGGGIGTQIFAHQVEQAARLGVKEIRATASGDFGLNGYYAWARLGYNARIPSSVKSNLPAKFQGATTVSDLMATAEGRQAWKTHGKTLEMTFDLRPGSYSRTQLANYLKERKAQGR